MYFFLIDKNAHIHVHVGLFKLPLFYFIFLLPSSNVALLPLFFFFFPGQRCLSFFFFLA